MSMSNILMPEPSRAQRENMRVQLDMKILEVISRQTGRTDWFNDADEREAMMARGKEREYRDGTIVYSFDGKDCILARPWEMREGEWGRPIEELYDRSDYVHHTKEDEAG